MKSTPAALVLLALAALGAVSLGGCLGGNSSETVGASAEVFLREGTIEVRTGAGFQVGLYASDYRPHVDSGYADTAWADAGGRHVFAGLAAGSFGILVRAVPGGEVVFLGGLVLPPAVPGERRGGDLRAPGALKGNIGDTALAGRPWVFLPGTPFAALGDTAGTYRLAGLPAGDFEVRREWLRWRTCENHACGFLENRSDTANVRIESGQGTAW